MVAGLCCLVERQPHNPLKCCISMEEEVVINDIVLPEPEFSSRYGHEGRYISETQKYGVFRFTQVNVENIESPDWESLAREEIVRANKAEQKRAEAQYKYHALVQQLVKAGIVKKPCVRCGSFKQDSYSDTNFVDGSYVSNSYVHCHACGYFEAFGPRW